MDEAARGVLLALVQGITEFLPISSSAHLILPSALLGWPDQGIVFDVAVHLGSLLAVLFYFRAELADLGRGSVRALGSGKMNEQAWLVLYLGVATLPVVVAGALLKDWVAGELRAVPVIAASTIGFGLLLGLADRREGAARIRLSTALWVGAAQVLAIIPGTSRSGITMTAGRFCGLGREESARFSFLLAIPAILGASLLASLEVIRGRIPVEIPTLLLGVTVSALTAYATIRIFLGLVQRVGFMPFVIYRCALGAVLLSVWWGGLA